MDTRTFPIALLARLFRMGTEGSPDPRRAKRIILSNQISISIALLSLPFILIYVSSGASLMGWLEIPVFLGYASVHRFNRAGFTWFSRIGLITLANLDILVYTLAMGTATGQHLFFLLAGWAPLVLFDWEERRSILYGIALSSVLLLGTEFLAPGAGLLDPAANPSNHGLRLVEMSTLLLVQILLMAYFARANRATETALARAGEAAKAADLAKSRFLAKMSGEIRAPLDAIRGLSDLLLRSGLEPGRRETVEDIRHSAQDLHALLDGILDLSRIESGSMRLEPAPFSPLRLAHSVLRPFEVEAGEKRLGLDLETGGDLPAHALGDAARIKQVLRNLLGNAFKFMESGKVTLRILREPASPGGMPGLRFEIEDTGIGIPASAYGRIFEPFTQADASTTRKYGGTGLGLCICKQLVEFMGGSIGLYPRPGGGTIFHFSVPAPEVPDPAAPTADAKVKGDP